MKNPQVDVYFLEGCGRCPKVSTPECKVNTWREVLYALREILLTTELVEERKWGVPCYTFGGKNVVILSALQERCVLSFFKGSLLKDPKGILKKPGENTQSGRILEFFNKEDVEKLSSTILEYIQEAILIEKSGKKEKIQKTKELEIPNELETFFQKSPELKKAFFSLTQGRQRGYILYFTAPKQTQTRISRIEKCIPLILEGVGLHDKYKSK